MIAPRRAASNRTTNQVPALGELRPSQLRSNSWVASAHTMAASPVRLAARETIQSYRSIISRMHGPIACEQVRNTFIVRSAHTPWQLLLLLLTDRDAAPTLCVGVLFPTVLFISGCMHLCVHSDFPPQRTAANWGIFVSSVHLSWHFTPSVSPDLQPATNGPRCALHHGQQASRTLVRMHRYPL